MANRRLLLAATATLAALIVVKAGLFIAAGQPPLVRDALGYWELGSRVAAGDLWLLEDSPSFRVPAFPWLLGACQRAFGTHALVAVTVLQQLSIVVTAFLSAWVCWRITGSPWSVPLALALSLTCISRSYLGLYVLSDNLLCLAVTLLVAALVWWFERPTLWRAVLIGLLLGCGTLIRPVMQLAFVPVLLAMAVPLWKSTRWRGLLKHGVCLVGSMALVVSPWLIRNQACFGQPFLTKSAGRQLWDCCFLGEPDGNWFNATIPFAADDPATARVLGELADADVGLHNAWTVYPALLALGYSENESDDLMLAVGREAVAADPGRFACVRAYGCLVFWMTADETFHWYYAEPGYDYIAADFVPRKPFAPTDARERPTYAGQEIRCWPPGGDALEWLTARLWWPSRLLFALVAAVTLWAWIVWVQRIGPRGLALALGLILLYFTLTTGLLTRPVYRYRMVLEPMIVTMIACALVRWRPGLGSDHQQRGTEFHAVPETTE